MCLHIRNNTAFEKSTMGGICGCTLQMDFRLPHTGSQNEESVKDTGYYCSLDGTESATWPPTDTRDSTYCRSRRLNAAGQHETVDLGTSRSRETVFEPGPWIAPDAGSPHLKPVNLAPLKGVLESDPMRSRILRVLIEDGGWVTTSDLLKVARQVRPIVGAVTIGTILSGLNDLVSARLILSRSPLASGMDWAEWRINPDWLEPTRRLLQMLTRARLREVQRD